MAEKDQIYNGKMKYKGIFSFKDFYKFCHTWLVDEAGLMITENKYSEKITGDTKSIEVKWTGLKDMTDYFRYEIEVVMEIRGLSKVQINENGRKIDTNEGTNEMKVKGFLVRDYKGKFETTAFNKLLRGIYEKWVITARVDYFKEKIFNDTGDFLAQAKAFLDLEGKKA